MPEPAEVVSVVRRFWIPSFPKLVTPKAAVAPLATVRFAAVQELVFPP